jgi:hypothetical protein
MRVLLCHSGRSICGAVVRLKSRPIAPCHNVLSRSMSVRTSIFSAHTLGTPDLACVHAKCGRMYSHVARMHVARENQ